MKHSPLPWSAHSCDAIATDQDSGERFIEIMAGPVTFSPFLGYRNGRIAHGEHVASVWGRGEDNTIRNANAALIVHRVNTYDALVEALERTSAMLEREYLHFTKDTPEGKAILDLRAALELAKVKP